MSTLKLGTIATQDGTESTDVTNVVNGSAKAWVNFNGTYTVAIQASFNVSSITDNNTGDYTVNFTTAMVDANYQISMSSVGYSNTNNSLHAYVKGNTSPVTTPFLKSTSQLRVVYSNDGGASTLYNCAEMNVAVFR